MHQASTPFCRLTTLRYTQHAQRALTGVYVSKIYHVQVLHEPLLWQTQQRQRLLAYDLQGLLGLCMRPPGGGLLGLREARLAGRHEGLA